MTEKDFKKLLSQGTAMQRVLLIANHLADTRLGGEGVLKKDELNALFASVTKKEIPLYNRIKRVEIDLGHLIPVFEYHMSEYRNVLTYIFGLVMQNQCYKTQEAMLNTLLRFVRKADKAAAVSELKDYFFPFADVVSKDGCTVIIDTERKIGRAKRQDTTTISYELATVKERARDIVRTVKTTIKYARDIMEKNAADIKTYRKQLDMIEDYFKTEKSFSFYNTKLVTKENIYGKYQVPDGYDSIEIDETLYQQLQ